MTSSSSPSSTPVAGASVMGFVRSVSTICAILSSWIPAKALAQATPRSWAACLVSKYPMSKKWKIWPMPLLFHWLPFYLAPGIPIVSPGDRAMSGSLSVLDSHREFLSQIFLEGSRFSHSYFSLQVGASGSHTPVHPPGIRLCRYCYPPVHIHKAPGYAAGGNVAVITQPN